MLAFDNSEEVQTLNNDEDTVIVSANNLKILKDFITNLRLNYDKCQQDSESVKLGSNSTSEREIVEVSDGLGFFNILSETYPTIIIDEVYAFLDPKIPVKNISSYEYLSQHSYIVTDMDLFEEVVNIAKGSSKLTPDEKDQLDKYSHAAHKLYEKKISLVPSQIQEILLNGKPLEPTKSILSDFTSKVQINDGEKSMIDFSQAQYSSFTQDQIVKNVYGKLPIIPEDDKKYLIEYKKAKSDKYVTFLRTGITEIEDLEEIVLSNLKLDEIFQRIPPLPQDILLVRGGDGIGKTLEQGQTGTYFQPISTTYNLDVAKYKFNRKILYEIPIEQGLKGIPLDLILPGKSFGMAAGLTENEVLLPPFEYEVKSCENLGEADFPYYFSKSKISMTNIRQLSIAEILKNRVHDLKSNQIVTQLLESANELETIPETIKTDINQKNLNTIYTELTKSGNIDKVKQKDTDISNDSLQYNSPLHGKNHTRRVNFFATAIAQEVGLSDKELEILLTAVQNHDIGRTNDNEESMHGKLSVKKIFEQDSQRFSTFNKEETELITFLMEQHSKSKKQNDAAISDLPKEKREQYSLMLNCMKDADKLDRIRLDPYGILPEEGLDVNRLSLPVSKTFVKAAYQANSYLITILDNINGNPELSEEKIALIDRMEKLIDEHMEKDFTPYPTEKVEYLEFNTNSAQPKKEENTFLQSLINRSKQNVSLFNMNEIIKSIKHHIKEKILNSTKEKNNTNLER